MPTYDSYVICTSPRSGSTLLCKLLAATGVAGNPDSHFHQPSVARWLHSFGITPDVSLPERDLLDAVFQAAIARGTLGTGMFGLRLQRHSFAFFFEKLATLKPGIATDCQRFEAAFGRTLFIHLTRQDKVEQAISYVKAQQTGLWHAAPDGTELERISPPREPAYDADQIRIGHREVTSHDRDWEDWFTAEDIKPFRITYEKLSESPVTVLRDTLDRLGLDRAAAGGVEPDVRKLADVTNDEWATRFRTELSGRPVAP